MDFAKAITYVFEDRRWLSKLGLAAVIFLVPILNFAVIDQSVEIVRRMRRQASEVLPEWDELGQRFMDGLLL
ncbi:MAG: hypothetical protein ACK4VW_00060 [Anaerolineales bacterium]